MRNLLFICMFFWVFHLSIYGRDKYMFTYNVYDQVGKPSTTETTVKPKYYRPLISAALSAALPGLGQAYNKKYWKTPIVLAIMAVPIYFTVYGAVMEKKALEYYWYLKEVDYNKQLLVFEADIALDPNTVNTPDYMNFIKTKPIPPSGIRPKNRKDEFPNETTPEQMQPEAESYRSDFETAIIFTVLAYLLNVVDAFADGYFYKYDIGENLSVQVEPTTFSRHIFYTQHFKNTLMPGLKVNIKF